MQLVVLQLKHIQHILDQCLLSLSSTIGLIEIQDRGYRLLNNWCLSHFGRLYPLVYNWQLDRLHTLSLNLRHVRHLPIYILLLHGNLLYRSYLPIQSLQRLLLYLNIDLGIPRNILWVQIVIWTRVLHYLWKISDKTIWLHPLGHLQRPWCNLVDWQGLEGTMDWNISDTYRIVDRSNPTVIELLLRINWSIWR